MRVLAGFCHFLPFFLAFLAILGYFGPFRPYAFQAKWPTRVLTTLDVLFFKKKLKSDNLFFLSVSSHRFFTRLQ